MPQLNIDTAEETYPATLGNTDSDAEIAALSAAENQLSTGSKESDNKDKPKTLADSKDAALTNSESAANSRKGKESIKMPEAEQALAKPLDISQHLINNNERLKQLQQTGQKTAQPALEQAAQTQITPEQLQQQRSADAVTNALRIGDQTVREASTTQNRTYASPAAQKVYEDLITNRQKQMEQQQAVSDSLQKRGLLQQAAPLAQAQALQQAQVEGNKNTIEQAKAPGELEQQSQILKNMRAQNDLETQKAEAAGRANDFAKAQMPQSQKDFFTSNGVTVEPDAKNADFDRYEKMYKTKATAGLSQARLNLQTQRFGLQTERLNTAQQDKAVSAYDKDPLVVGANTTLASSRKLSDMLDHPENETANNMAMKLKAKELLGNTKMTNYLAQNSGLLSTKARIEEWMSEKGEGTMSDQQRSDLRQLVTIADQNAQEDKEIVGNRVTNSYSTPRTATDYLKQKIKPTEDNTNQTQPKTQGNGSAQEGDTKTMSSGAVFKYHNGSWIKQ